MISTPQDARFRRACARSPTGTAFCCAAIDQPAYGFVAMQAVVKSGPARIAISTGGVSPRVGGILRAALQAALDAKFARFLDALRAAAPERACDAIPDDAAARRAAMMSAAEGFEVEVQRDVSRPGSSKRMAALMASVEIVTIGTEMLLGHLVDTNSVYVARDAGRSRRRRVREAFRRR